MKNLYIDFDGVIVDSIRVTYDMLNWKQILSLTPIINDSFTCIDKIIDSNKFNISILTHVNSLDEAIAKVNYIRKYAKSVTIIPVPREISKTKMIDAKDAILIDDYSGNLKEWEAAGGIGIQFSTDLTKDKGFKVIDKLDKIIDMY